MQRSGGRRNNNNYKAKAIIDDKEETNPLLKAFKEYARELDTKHDRYERIVKMSRDITIESKRIIFLLHTIDARKCNRERIVGEADERLNNLIANNFKAIALELVDQDPYQYRGAYSPGLQEFIEAYTFMEFLKQDDNNIEGGESQGKCQMSDWEVMQQKMKYTVTDDKNSTETDAQQIEIALSEKVEENPDSIGKEVSFHIDPTEYILGVADLTGELMRRCINSLGSGETHVCLSTCKSLKQFYAGYNSLFVIRCRELSRKIYTMRQSLLKAEQVCYNVKVRGSEAAKWGAMGWDNKATDDVDEGFF